MYVKIIRTKYSRSQKYLLLIKIWVIYLIIICIDCVTLCILVETLKRDHIT